MIHQSSLWLLLLQDHRDAVEGQIFPLDMAPHSVDDQFKGCREKMRKRVKTTYLKQELSNSDDFRNAWETGKNKVNHTFVNILSNLKKKHKIAIWVYTDPESKIYVKFNSDTRNGKETYKDYKYKWYSLHFLLTDAIQILKKKQKKCFQTFRGTNVKLNGQVFTDIRFGSFTSSSDSKYIAKTFFGNVSCFEIRTCEGANITKYSSLRYESEVLIPPYEMFKVTDIKTKGQEGAWCDTVFMLNSAGTRSDLNCALFKKPMVCTV